MSYFTSFKVLDVGQGSGNFIELSATDDGTPRRTILADFGSEGDSKAAGVPSVRYVAKRLKKMKPPTIDALFITHSDKDHKNLLVKLLKEFPDAKDLDIKKAFYGGAYGDYDYTENKKKVNLIDKIKSYMFEGDKPEGYTSYCSSFHGKDAKDVKPLATVGDTEIYVIMGNMSSTDEDMEPEGNDQVAPNGYVKNTVSLVLLVIVSNESTATKSAFVITGDATGQTLAMCNSVISSGITDGYLVDVFMVTAPHHGSETTAFDLKGLRGVDATDNVRIFARGIGADCITASAARNRLFGHPSIKVLELFWDVIYKEPYYIEEGIDPYHFFTAFFRPDDGVRMPGDPDSDDDDDDEIVYRPWPRSGDFWTMYTNTNMYSNLYYYKERNHDIQPYIIPPKDLEAAMKPPGMPPARGVAWAFKIDQFGERTLDRIVNRSKLASLLARLALPLPPWPRLLPRPGAPNRRPRWATTPMTPRATGLPRRPPARPPAPPHPAALTTVEAARARRARVFP